MRFYLFLNCIYNLKEKLEIFFCFNKDFEKNILSEQGKEKILKLFKENYKKIEKFCLARGYIVHDIYRIKYNISKNEINIGCSNFNLSADDLTINKPKMVLSLDENILINLVEEIQILRKKTIEFLYDFKNNIDLKKLKNKFKYDKGFMIKG